jgi:hypothetical protein
LIRSNRACIVSQRSPKTGRSYTPLSNQAIHRTHFKLNAQASYEDSIVLWLQADCWFADVRVNRDSGEIYSGFGGVTWWHRPTLFFQHIINISGNLTDQDIGQIALKSFGCLETGSLIEGSKRSIFEERWRFEQSQNTAVYTLIRRGKLIGLEIQTEKYCILIIRNKAKVFSHCGHGSWRTIFSNASPANCWQPTLKKSRPEWLLRESASSR